MYISLSLSLYIYIYIIYIYIYIYIGPSARHALLPAVPERQDPGWLQALDGHDVLYSTLL